MFVEWMNEWPNLILTQQTPSMVHFSGSQPWLCWESLGGFNRKCWCSSSNPIGSNLISLGLGESGHYYYFFKVLKLILMCSHLYQNPHLNLKLVTPGREKPPKAGPISQTSHFHWSSYLQEAKATPRVTGAELGLCWGQGHKLCGP